jgi:hypothetical protein
VIKSSRTGRRWATAVIEKLWNIAWDIWEHRNGILHRQENLVAQSLIIQLNARVSRTYTELSSRTLRHNDRHLVYLTLFTLLQWDTNYKITWLSVAEPALRETRRDQWQTSTRSRRMVQGMQRCMFTWLRR